MKREEGLNEEGKLGGGELVGRVMGRQEGMNKVRMGRMK